MNGRADPNKGSVLLYCGVKVTLAAFISARARKIAVNSQSKCNSSTRGCIWYGNSIYEWGCKLFYFDRRKCQQFVHFKTRLVIFLVDVKIADIEHAADMVAQYLLALYNDDKDMQKSLEKYFASAPICKRKIRIWTNSHTNKAGWSSSYYIHAMRFNSISRRCQRASGQTQF